VTVLASGGDYHGDTLDSMPGPRRPCHSRDGFGRQYYADPEYEALTGTCKLKKTALGGGPLAQLVERISEDTLASRGTLCDLRAV
jgi:hypothetical protein